MFLFSDVAEISGVIGDASRREFVVRTEPFRSDAEAWRWHQELSRGRLPPGRLRGWAADVHGRRRFRLPQSHPDVGGVDGTRVAYGLEVDRGGRVWTWAPATPLLDEALAEVCATTTRALVVCLVARSPALLGRRARHA